MTHDWMLSSVSQVICVQARSVIAMTLFLVLSDQVTPVVLFVNTTQIQMYKHMSVILQNIVLLVQEHVYVIDEESMNELCVHPS